MRLALDTNVYADFARGDAQVTDTLERAEEVHLPFVVLAELRAGFAAGTRTKENALGLQRFLATPGVGVVYATDATTRCYASLYRQLRAQGTPIPTNDLWIASLVVEHGLRLYTRDRQFDCLGQLDLV